jgi:hypothetical protein
VQASRYLQSSRRPGRKTQSSDRTSTGRAESREQGRCCLVCLHGHVHDACMQAFHFRGDRLSPLSSLRVVSLSLSDPSARDARLAVLASPLQADSIIANSDIISVLVACRCKTIVRLAWRAWQAHHRIRTSMAQGKATSKLLLL